MDQFVRIRIPNVADDIRIRFYNGGSGKEWYLYSVGWLAARSGTYAESGTNIILYATASDGSLARLIRLDTVRLTPYSAATQVRLDLEADAAVVIEPLAQFLTLGHSPRMAAPLRREAQNYFGIFTMREGSGHFYQGSLHGTVGNIGLAQRAGTITWTLE